MYMFSLIWLSKTKQTTFIVFNVFKLIYTLTLKLWNFCVFLEYCKFFDLIEYKQFSNEKQFQNGSSLVLYVVTTGDKSGTSSILARKEHYTFPLMLSRPTDQ